MNELRSKKIGTTTHIQLAAAYSKIVAHPVDLGHVCRGIRRRQYRSTRDVRLDLWRVFANCVKFHSHRNNKEAVPSFVSIALHLREFFNNLWQEYMLASELPDDANEFVQESFLRRQHERRRNLENSGVLVLNAKITSKTAKLLADFIAAGGCTDGLDRHAIFGPKTAAATQHPDLDVVVTNLTQLQEKLDAMTGEYTVEKFHLDLMECYTKEVLEDNPALRHVVSNRLNRLFWKLLIPLHEANSRGVTQSSIWGNIAATIWARESSKKPFWPALCLGILPPEDQREGWHDAVTERNEGRLPEKLRMQLEVAKKKCLQAQKKQSMSYFLVEFLGTHEFIWVRETDIVENFDPANDPNKKVNSESKKKRASRSGISSVVGSKTYATALEECVWANEEYENVLQDAFDCNSDQEVVEDDGEEMNYSYSILSQSDDEADNEDKHHFVYSEVSMTMSDIDEANWLFEHGGLLDTSVNGRKNAKKRTQELIKKAAVKDKSKEKKTPVEESEPKLESPKKKLTEAQGKEDRGRDRKKEQRELENRRRKRMREREKALCTDPRSNKRKRVPLDDSDDGERGLAHDKRARATAIVRAYLTRMARKEDYRSLALGGVMTLPSSMVDSTGLLGMALAFRASAGEISMPDDGERQVTKQKPWTTVSWTSAKTSSERTLALENQTVHLQKQLERVRTNIEHRKDLAREAIAQRLRIENYIKGDDEAARRNHFKKKIVSAKKIFPKPSGNQSAEGSPGPGKSEGIVMDGGENDNNDSTSADVVPRKEGVEAGEVERLDEDKLNGLSIVGAQGTAAEQPLDGIAEIVQVGSSSIPAADVDIVGSR
jgi:hypothetical protein